MNIKIYSIIASFLMLLCFHFQLAKAAGGTVTLNYLIGDGTTDQTIPLQSAIDSTGQAGGGTLIIPKGAYLIKPIFLRSNLTLQLDSGATLKATSNMNAWSISGKLYSLINGDSLNNVSITGSGTIDGSGSVWWTAYNANKSLKRPRLINFGHIQNLTIDGITLQNSPSFHLRFGPAKYVTINNVTITAPSNSPNTDGIDPANSKHVTITGCTIGTGDDNIAIKSGRSSGAITQESLSEDIHVSNCKFLTGHGMSIGSETDSGVNGLYVNNCTFNGTTNGIRIKSAVGIGGVIQNVYYRNIKMTKVTNPLIITFAYTGNSGTYPDTPSVKGFYIDSLVATGSKNAGSLVGTSYSYLDEIHLSNINISSSTGLVITDAKNVYLCKVTITPQTGSNILATNVTFGYDNIDTLTASTVTPQSITLDWNVICPNASIKYVVSKSNDGNNFTVLNTIPGDITTQDFQYTDNTFSNTSNFYYKVGSIAAGNADTIWSNTLKFTKEITNGINHGINSSGSLNIYPNPSKDQLVVEHGPTNKNTFITIIAYDGRTIMSIPINIGTEKTVIDITSIATGLYYIIIGNGNQKKAGRFSKY